MLFIPNQEIKEIAREVGFQEAGIAKACLLDNEKSALERWLFNQYQAGMNYMENYFEKRIHPCLLVENAHSIVSVLLSYKPESEMHGKLKIAKYAYGKDYHFLLKEKLYKMIATIQSKYPTFSAIPYVDSAPVMEKAWAVRAGLGWIGKNTCLINQKWGSFCFIGELVCNAISEYDIPVKNHCGNCNKCIQACPNKALEEPYLLNCNKCISYHTIENKSSKLPDEIDLRNYIFGCDICQNNCIWNDKSLTNEKDFVFTPILELKENIQTNRIEEISKSEFKQLTKQTSLSRTSYDCFVRNIEKAKKDIANESF